MVLCWWSCLCLTAVCSCPKRQWVCGTEPMGGIWWVPSWLFDMTPDEPSAISLSSTSPLLVFAFCTIPLSLPSLSRGKWLCLQHRVWATLQVLGMALFSPLLCKLMAGGFTNKTPLHWGDLPAPTDLPLLQLQFLPHSLLLQGCGHLPTDIISTKVSARGAAQVPWVGGCQHVTV